MVVMLVCGPSCDNFAGNPQYTMICSRFTLHTDMEPCRCSVYQRLLEFLDFVDHHLPLYIAALPSMNFLNLCLVWLLFFCLYCMNSIATLFMGHSSGLEMVLQIEE